MGIADDVCRRCIGDGATSYRDVTVLCPDCLGTGNRPPTRGDQIEIGGRVLGILDWNDEGVLIAVCNVGETLPPTLDSVLDATGGPTLAAAPDDADWETES